jgi:hypothetical protein
LKMNMRSAERAAACAIWIWNDLDGRRGCFSGVWVESKVMCTAGNILRMCTLELLKILCERHSMMVENIIWQFDVDGMKIKWCGEKGKRSNFKGRL